MPDNENGRHQPIVPYPTHGAGQHSPRLPSSSAPTAPEGSACPIIRTGRHLPCFVQLGCRPRDRAMTGPLAALWIVALLHAAAALGVVLILATEQALW